MFSSEHFGKGKFLVIGHFFCYSYVFQQKRIINYRHYNLLDFETRITIITYKFITKRKE